MTLYGGNILIIGVDLAVRDSITAFLRTKGYTPHQVQTLEEGVAALQRQAFGAVVLLEPIVSDMHGRKFLDIVVKLKSAMLEPISKSLEQHRNGREPYKTQSVMPNIPSKPVHCPPLNRDVSTTVELRAY
jgi:CheY-like chemotaxis protein